MDGFRAFKFYSAIKLHFTSKTYDVFKHNGHVKGTQDAYMRRNDYGLFEKLARKFKDDRTFIQYVAANFMYSNPNVIWDDIDGDANYMEFKRRRESITRVFENDLHIISGYDVPYEHMLNFNNGAFPGILSLHTLDKITIETVSIINDLTNFIDKIEDNPFRLVIEQQLMLIKKSKGFIKYDRDKINKVYQTFIGETKGYNHGTHVPQQQLYAI